MLIPIGKERTEVRRWPWVSIAILVLNFLPMSLTWKLLSPEEEKIMLRGERLRRIGDYLIGHPFLEVPPEVKDYSGDNDFRFLRVKARIEHEERYPPPTEAELERQREELARLVKAYAEDKPSANVLQQWGFIPHDRRWVTVVTSMFLHAGWLHLLGNVLMLYLTAPFIEDAFGRALFTVLYLVAGVAAAGAHYHHFPDSRIPLVGASGAIAGIMGAFMIRFGGERLRFIYMPIFFLPTWYFTFQLRAALFLALWALEQVVFGLALAQKAGVAFWAHVGGFGFGVLFALGMKLLRVEKEIIHPAIERETTLVAHPSLERALDARRGGDLATARREIRRVLSVEPENLDAWSEAYDIALAAGDMAEAARRASGLLKLYLQHGETQLAGSLVRDALDRKLPGLPQPFWTTAGGVAEKYDPRWALEFYQQAVEAAPGEAGAMKALIRQGQILRGLGETAEARKAFERARAHRACNDAVRQSIDRALAEM